MATHALKIGVLAKVTRTTPPTIRYYEEIGLLPPPSRLSGSQRIYEEADVQRLVFIRRCREFGFSIDKVRQLLKLLQNGDQPCREARDLAFSHLSQVREKLAEWCKLERSLAAFVDGCDRSCPDGTGADCIILGGLGEPGERTGCCSQTPCAAPVFPSGTRKT